MFDRELGVPVVSKSGQYVPMMPVQGAPASPSDPGFPGEIRFDDNYVYLCTNPDTWKRIALETWV